MLFNSLCIYNSVINRTTCQVYKKLIPCIRTSFFHTSIVNVLSSQNTSVHLKDVEDVAHYIKEKAQNILIMTGAGISTPSGIPDFRSPGTGLYHNLQKYNLPYPEAIFDIQFFMMDQRPFFTLAQDLYPGENYRPNLAHYFLVLLHHKEKLQKVYTQNIDGLERLAGMPVEKLMEAHGTFASASCLRCHEKHDAEAVKDCIMKKLSPPSCLHCKGKVKPDIVFFGENLPENFWDFQNESHFTDLLLVIGTSLEVHPFASVADAVGSKTPRVLINRDVAGSFGSRPGDLVLDGDLLETIGTLVNIMGWDEDLKDIM